MDGYHHCPACGKKFRKDDVENEEEYIYTCENCGTTTVYHMNGKYSTFDCPICARNYVANYRAIRSLKFERRENSMYGSLI